MSPGDAQGMLFDAGPPKTTGLPWLDARDKSMLRVKENAGKEFHQLARRFIQDYLGKWGQAPGEVITDACKKSGVQPHDDRAFGPVYLSLVRDGLIEKCGTCARRKGHGTTGGNVWRLKR